MIRDPPNATVSTVPELIRLRTLEREMPTARPHSAARHPHFSVAVIWGIVGKRYPSTSDQCHSPPWRVAGFRGAHHALRRPEMLPGRNQARYNPLVELVNGRHEKIGKFSISLAALFRATWGPARPRRVIDQAAQHERMPSGVIRSASARLSKLQRFTATTTNSAPAQYKADRPRPVAACGP